MKTIGKLRVAMKPVLVAAVIAVVAGFPLVSWATASQPEPVVETHAVEGEGGEHAAAEGAEHAHWPPPSINWTDLSDKARPPFVAMAVNFVLLIALYYAVGKKGIAQGLKNRRDAVAKEIEEATRMKREAEERAKTYQAKLARLEDELATARQALVEAGQGERERIVREAEEKAARMRRDADMRNEQEMKQMRQDIWREAVEQAVTAAEDLLKKRVTQSDHERLAEEYLADFSQPAKTAAARGAS